MPTQEPPNPEEQRWHVPRESRVYLYAMLGALVVLLLTIGITITIRQRGDREEVGPGSQANSAAAGPTTENTPTSQPTDLPRREALGRIVTPIADVQLPEPTATEQTSVLALPTVTPTPELAAVIPREIQISGSTTMRLALSGEGFDSTGRPLNFELEPREATLGGEDLELADQWCVQLGLVNEAYDIAARIDPVTQDLRVSGTVSLRGGFCDQPGGMMDSVDVNLSVPVGSAAQISYNLRGQQSLLGLQGLLDSDTGAIVELRVRHASPR
jgi:hypothetical protein